MISPSAHVDPAAKIGKDVTIHPFAYVDADTVIGDGCEIMPYASVIHGTTLGKNVKVYQGAIVGADPQDFRWKGEPSHCFVGDNTVIREHVIINRGIYTSGGTSVGPDCFVMADSHIGHDSEIVGRCVVGNGVTIAGHVHVDEGTILSSGVILHEKSRVGKFCLIKGGTRISGNVPPFVIMAHNPAGYYGVNAIVMQKHAGYTDEQIQNISKSYRHIYRTATSVFNALQRIETDVEPSQVRDEIVNFVRSCDLRLAGRNFDLDD